MVKINTGPSRGIFFVDLLSGNVHKQTRSNDFLKPTALTSPSNVEYLIIRKRGDANDHNWKECKSEMTKHEAFRNILNLTAALNCLWVYYKVYLQFSSCKYVEIVEFVQQFT